MKFKLIAAILGLTMTFPAAIMAQNPLPDDQSQDQDQYAKPSPNVPMQDNQDATDHDSTSQRQAHQNYDQPADRGYDQRSNQTYNQTPNDSYGRGSSAPAPTYDRRGNDQQGYDEQGYDQRGNDQQGYDQPRNDQQGNERPSYGQPNYDQGYGNRGPMDPGLNSNNENYNQPSYNTPAPQENNGVARVSLMKGDVSTQRGDASNWEAAVVNAPVLAGDRISTGDKARTELQLDFANTLRLSEHSQANITQLTRTQIQIQLANGMANYSVSGNSDADAEIDTPNVAIRTERRDSSFRVLVTGDDHTEVLVRKGEVEITTQQGGTRVGEGQFITIQGVNDQAQYQIGEAPARDDWDQWNTDRDGLILNAASRKHTDPYYVGTEDLDAHGTWSEVPDYGQVWRPNDVGADWAPYRDGRWVYEPYWGWTWVSYDSWGWAPYHYGRWMMIDGGWGWWPGPIYGNAFYRPIWAPAYVSFFGFGGGFGVGFGYGFGSIGWLPLGPCDHFYPWYGRYGGRFGYAGFDRFNRGGFAPLHGGNRFSNVNLAFHNPNFRGATSVSGREFGSGRMSAHVMSHNEMQNARFSTGRLPVTPSRASYSASGRAGAASTTHNASLNQHFFSTRGSAASPNRAVANGRESARVMNRPGSSSGANRGFERPGAARPSAARTSADRPSAARPGQNSSVRSNSNARTSQSSNSGWQKFSTMSPRSTSPSSSPSMRGSAASSRPSMGGSENRGSYGPSRSASPEGRSYSAPSQGRSSGAPSRSYGSEGRSYGSTSRPTLNLRQPIVSPRPSGGGSYGGARSAPGYGGGAPRSAPSYGGGHPAPSSHSSGGGSTHGGGSSHSSSGGGSSHGGHGR